jgi:hypothetical protein
VDLNVSAFQLFKDLSESQQHAMLRAFWDGIPVDDPRSVRVERRTANALEAHGLLVRRTTKKHKEHWRPTERGRELVTAHEPRLLGARSGYTSDLAKAMFAEPEAVDDHVLAVSRRAAHDVESQRFDRLREDRKRLAPAERLRIITAEAEARGVVVDRELFVIAKKLEAMEERVHRPADRFADAEPADS